METKYLEIFINGNPLSYPALRMLATWVVFYLGGFFAGWLAWG